MGLDGRGETLARVCVWVGGLRRSKSEGSKE